MINQSRNSEIRDESGHSARIEVNICSFIWSNVILKPLIFIKKHRMIGETGYTISLSNKNRTIALIHTVISQGFEVAVRK